MKRTARLLLATAVVTAVVGLALAGQRLAPPVQTPTGSDSRATCHVEAPEALRAAAQHWCTNGLFARVSVTGDAKHVIAVAQLSTNGAQVWQIQNSGLLSSFRALTSEMATASSGRDVSISVQDAADRRLAACARDATNTVATCELK
jgi:hypothetical protein